MKKNVKVGQANEWIKGDHVYDIHNCYDYVGLLLLNCGRTLELIFEPNKDHGKGFNSIRLQFYGISFLEFSSGFGTAFTFNVEEVGYKTSGDNDDNWLLSEGQSLNSDHLFFRFNGDEYIRVYSADADLKVF